MSEGLTMAQISELAAGPLDSKRSVFTSEAARKAAWRAHSGHIAHFVKPGATPWAERRYGRTEPDTPTPAPRRSFAAEYDPLGGYWEKFGEAE